MALYDEPKKPWYKKVTSFSIEDLFSRKKPLGLPRVIYVNEPLPADYLDKKGRPKKEHVYPTNQVITSKYTVITFLPRNLLEQFRRVANIFFLGINILQFFPKFSTISPGLVILPLAAILALTAIKDGYEDARRHQADRTVNHTLVRVLNADDWVNPNAMSPKSRTFTRGIKLPGSKKTTTPPADADVEMQHRDAPPEAIASSSSNSPHPEPDIEFDDEDLTEEEGVGSIFEHREHTKRAHWKKTMWEDLRVGDIIKIMDNESIPADILICATSEEENVAYIETKNLDGETNLKSRSAVPALTHLRTAHECALKTNNLRVELGRPEVNMYNLTAAVSYQGKAHPVDLQETLLRGTTLRNTTWAIGMVLFTGSDTKIVLNSGGTPSKRSKVERQMDPQVGYNLALIAIMALACGIADSLIEQVDYPEGALWLYDDNSASDNPKINGLITFIFSLITFQNIVPISLYISIEFVRTLQSAFIYFDKEIWYEKTDQATIARTWNLSDDLGQIEYIFSDKTGTLTQNSMVFRQCSIHGKVYTGDEETEEIIDPDPGAKTTIRLSDTNSSQESKNDEFHTNDPMKAHGVKLAEGVLTHFTDKALKDDLAEAASGRENQDSARALNGFFTVLGLCHTVIAAVDSKTGALEYKAQSPDEAALVQAAADVGFIFRGKDKDVLRLQTPFSEDIEEYDLLNILEFTSARKRMSVVVRKKGQDGRLFLLTKGADNVIFERLKAGGESLKQVTEKQLDEFANSGLRTLTLAYRVINEAEYESWSEQYHQATVAIDHREEEIARVSNELEKELRLLGATAIEDKLQDGVPETIADLKRAGIKIWVATGDKLETAIAIGKSTNLIAPQSNIIIVRGGTRPVYDQLLASVETYFPETDIAHDAKINTGEPAATDKSGPIPLRRVNTNVSSIVGSDNGEREGGFVLVIDGGALTQALGDEQHKYLLLKLAIQCEGVICCRVSPLQKALIVKLVKRGLGAMCLAIGDGANDVSMIQAADVGVGINGQEGLQAANSSDYAIAQFRFLKRLLFVHGHWSYQRNGNMILNFFYKNIICVGVLWWFQIYCGWSGQYNMEYTYLLFWNSFWTIGPVIAIGLFDRVVDDHVLMALPELYKPAREGRYFTLAQFFFYMFDGIYQSAIVFFIVAFTYQTISARRDGYEVGIYEASTVMVYAATFAANLYNGMNTRVWTSWVWFALALGPVLLVLYSVVYESLPPSSLATNVWGNNIYLWGSAYYYLAVPITVIFALLPRFLYEFYKFGYSPSDIDIMRYANKLDPNRDFAKYAYAGGPLASYKSAQDAHGSTSRHASRVDVDMSTGLPSTHRGFDFSTEEGGVAMRRMQTNLSERRESNRHLPLDSGKKKLFFSLRKKPGSNSRT